MNNKILTLLLIVLLFTPCLTMNGQTRTVGLFLNDTSKVFKGYTLFSPKHYPYTYLINNEGKIINQWTKSIYEPGQSVYLLENGNLIRTCMVKGQMNTGGGEGGRVEEYDWNGNLVWELDFSSDTYMQHHDIKKLPNGNVLMLVVEIGAGAVLIDAIVRNLLRSGMLLSRGIIAVPLTLGISVLVVIGCVQRFIYAAIAVVVAIIGILGCAWIRGRV